MRMVATDLDGTILCDQMRISARTLAALASCVARGVHVVFVTGRPPRWLDPVTGLREVTGPAICANGALLLDVATGTAIRTRGLSADAVLETADRLRGAMPEASFAVELFDGMRREASFAPRHPHAAQAPTGALPDLLADGQTVLKLLCRSEQRTADDMLALARPLLAGIAEPVHSNPASSMLEISAAGVSKASALAELAADVGIAASEAIAFGDMPNDVPMLRWAGTSYAMANGHPEALAAADAVAAPCSEDGVAQVLEQRLGRSGERAPEQFRSGDA